MVGIWQAPAFPGYTPLKGEDQHLLPGHHSWRRFWGIWRTLEAGTSPFPSHCWKTGFSLIGLPDSRGHREQGLGWSILWGQRTCRVWKSSSVFPQSTAPGDLSNKDTAVPLAAASLLLSNQIFDIKFLLIKLIAKVNCPLKWKNAAGMYLGVGLCTSERTRFFEKSCFSDGDGISTLFFLHCSPPQAEVFKVNEGDVQGDSWHLHIWGYWYFSRQSWFQLVFLPILCFSWCTLHIS